MFSPDFCGRSIFCDIFQKPSPLIESIDLGNGRRAEYDTNAEYWRISNPDGSENTIKNLIPFISWKTQASIKLSLETELWSVACERGTLEKIGELVLIKYGKFIPWIKLNNKYFLFFKGIETKVWCGTYCGMDIYMPSTSQSIEIKIDALSIGSNISQIPYGAPGILIDFLLECIPNHNYLFKSNIHQLKIVSRNVPDLNQRQSQAGMKRGMIINNKKSTYKINPNIITNKDEIANTRAVIRELIKNGFRVGFREPKEHWFYFKEEISGLKWGATDDELTLCYYLEQCPPYVEPLYCTGEKSGLVVVDADVKNGIDGIKNFVDLCSKNAFDPYSTLLVLTPSGGLHFIFKYQKGHDIPCSASKLAIGVDIRANNGVAGAPGYIRKFGKGKGNAYMIINDTSPIEFPEFMIQLTRRNEFITKTNNRIPTRTDHAGQISTISTNPGDIAALDELAISAHIISTTAPGSRNDVLYKKAFKLGFLVYEGRLSEEFVITRLQTAASKCGLDKSEILPTIKSGLNGAYKYKSDSINES